ncbi:glycosyltransferase [Butyrivibrio sp. XPD2002]|uniref:glycosyltransferase n=1 Tax=Butyrivibrio sp. XPD2002 TaxID=1280665 RepID=UPI00040E3BE1|nr:glycosyltransferase [Butyrivibrio sp. XPD2002]
MAEPIRILHVFGTLGLGGAESRIMDLYRHIDRERVQFDFLVHADAEPTGKKCPTSDELMQVREPDYFDATVKKLGGNIYALPRFHGTNARDYKNAVRMFFMQHRGEWKMVQGHMTSTAAMYLPIAKSCGIGTTIAHARSAGVDPGIKGVVTRIIRAPLAKTDTCDLRFACTENAARSVFGDTLTDEGLVRIIPNAIDLRRFVYNQEIRDKVRRELGLSNAIIIGHVGRFHYAKNHEYLLKTFAEFLRILSHDDANSFSMLHGMRIRLLMLGEGPLMDTMKQLAADLHIEKYVVFCGNKSNANEYYQAMDYFLFPSRYEGLPGTVVEAQAAGLQCLVSDSITPEVDITPLVSRMSIEEPPAVWARKILNDLMLRDYEETAEGEEVTLPIGDREASSEPVIEMIRKAGFDVRTQAQRLQSFYLTGKF